MQQQINLGTPPSGVGGDSYRTSFTKVNQNFTEIYTVLGPSALSGQLVLTREHMSDAINLASSTTVASSTAVKVAYDLAATKLTATANAVSASKLVTSRTLSYTGDATGSTTFDGTSNVSAALTLANSGATAGTYPKVTINAKGLVTSGAALVATDIPALDTSKLTTGTLPVARGGTNLTASVQGGLLYGSSTSANAFTAAGAANQVLKSNGTSAPTWQTLDLTFLPDAFAKKSVKAATTANITLSGTQTVDGIALVANDRVLVKNQTTTSANGIYIVSATAWTRAPDADTSSELAGAVVNVDAGTVNGGLRFDSDFKTTDTLGTTAVTWNRAIDTGMAGSVIGTTLGTAAAGTSDKYAREDHVHPIQTTVSGNAGTATKLATARTISSSGDATWSVSFDGTVNASAALTLVNSGVAAGTYKSVTVDTKGRVTAANEVITGLVTSTTATGTSNLATTNTNTFLNITEQIGAAAASAGTSTQVVGAGTVTVSSDTSGKITITGAQSITGNAATATIATTANTLTTARTISLSGDITGSVSFNGSSNTVIASSITNKGLANGVATLDSSGKVPSDQLPSYVDDVLEYANFAAFPSIGDSGKIYIALETNLTYRWSGSVYVPVGGSSGSADSALKLFTARNISTTGDATWSVSFDGSADSTSALTLSNSGVTAGSYAKVTVDAKGRVIAGTTMVAADVPSLDTSKLTTGTLGVARGGTGLASFTQWGVPYASTTTAMAYTAAGTAGQVLKSNGAAAPTWVTLDLTYLPDAVVKKSVRVATTANITLSAPQTIDGIAVVANDRVLVKDQTTTSANGVYIVQAAAWTRAPDADTSAKIGGAVVNVDSGTANGGLRFDTDFKTTDTLGTTALTWQRSVDTGMASTVVGITPGTAAIGTSLNYARADHVHPVQTTVSGNAGTATKLATARTINGTPFDGTANITFNNLEPVAITSGQDFNSFTTPGMYYCPANSTAATLVNRPTASAFSMLVEKHAGVKQTVTEYMITNAKTYSRNFYSTWGPWYRVYTTIDEPGQFIGTQSTKAIYYNAQTITEDVTIPGSLNAMSAGPLTINTGFTVTISDGATWTIV